MQHQLGRIDIVSWQDRRMHDLHRPHVLSLTLAGLAAISAILLLLRFALGAPLPLGLLQVAFAILVGSCAFLAMRAAVGVILAFQRR
jgi:hypothetical protein